MLHKPNSKAINLQNHPSIYNLEHHYLLHLFRKKERKNIGWTFDPSGKLLCKTFAETKIKTFSQLVFISLDSVTAFSVFRRESAQLFQPSFMENEKWRTQKPCIYFFHWCQSWETDSNGYTRLNMMEGTFWNSSLFLILPSLNWLKNSGQTSQNFAIPRTVSLLGNIFREKLSTLFLVFFRDEIHFHILPSGGGAKIAAS